MSDTFKHGWRTMQDGQRIPLTEQEAKDIHVQIQKMKTARAEKLPTVVAALEAISEATGRLRELGWNTIGPRDGEEKAMIQYNSTGMWRAHRSGEYYHAEDCVYGLRDKSLFFKSIDQLTDDEHERIAYCVETRPRYL